MLSNKKLNFLKEYYVWKKYKKNSIERYKAHM